MRIRSKTALAAAMASALLLGACGGDDGGADADAATAAPGGADGVKLSLVGFAVPHEANNAVQAKFAEIPQGEGVSWEESYGASGEQSRAVAAGLEADYVHFSLEGDVTRLVKE